MRNKLFVGFAALTLLSASEDAQAQALPSYVASITNSTSSTLSFSFISGADETQKLDVSLKSQETRSFQIWAKTRLRVDVELNGGLRVIRYYEISSGLRYRFGVDDKQLYDLRLLNTVDQGESKLPFKEERQSVSKTQVIVANATGSDVAFSFGSVVDETQKWIDVKLTGQQTRPFEIPWARTWLRIAVRQGGFRIIRYYEVSPGRRYRIGIDDSDKQLYDLRQLNEGDSGEAKLTPAKEEKQAVKG